VVAARVAIAGGSLGGLNTALFLRQVGCDVTIYERSPDELEQRGAGIGFLPESYRYLDDVAGIDLDQISITTDHIRYLNRKGEVTHDFPVHYRFSSWNTVYRELLQCFGTDRYFLDHDVVRFSQDGDGVEIEFGDGSKTEVDLLVCAEGITSSARRQLLPEVEPIYAGYVAWRGTVPADVLEPETLLCLGDAITYFVYANSHILVYPIPGMDGSVDPYHRLVNFVWYRNYKQGGDLEDLLTDRDGVLREISLPPGLAREEHVNEMRAAAQARLPRVIAEVIEKTVEPFVQVIFDVEIPKMAFGKVCLIGDAAFVGRPHAAAGTAKAADDGWALSESVASLDTITAALLDWEPGRLKLGQSLVDRTRRVGAHSQFEDSWDPNDPELIFGLYRPGT
jgi:2,6-dihydroxypyridine 3-monooxygenase